MKNKYLELEKIDDFGFTTMDEADIMSPALTDEVQDLKHRLEAVRNIFMPLLENLSKNPQQELIKWPNREGVLKEKMNQLKSLTTV